MIAAEVATRLGTDLGFRTPQRHHGGDRPAWRRRTLASPPPCSVARGYRDGVVVPLGSAPPADGSRPSQAPCPSRSTRPRAGAAGVRDRRHRRRAGVAPAESMSRSTRGRAPGAADVDRPRRCRRRCRRSMRTPCASSAGACSTTSARPCSTRRRWPSSRPATALGSTRTTSSDLASSRRQGARAQRPPHADRRACCPMPGAAWLDLASPSTRARKARPTSSTSPDPSPRSRWRRYVIPERPAVRRGPQPHRRGHRADQDARRLRRAARRHDVHGVVRAQDHLRHAEPHRSRPRRSMGDPADARRRHQVLLQGGHPPGRGRQARVPVGAGARCRPRVPFVRRDPHRRHDHAVRSHHQPAAGRPAHRHPVPAGDVVARGLRRDARRVVVGLEVPAARRGARLRADDLLRGGHGPFGRHRDPRLRFAVDAGDRRQRSWLGAAGTSSPSGWCRSSFSSSPAPPSSTGPRSTWSRPSRSWSAASTPSTRRSASRCSSWPSS